MGSTLHDDQTHAALVGGYAVSFKNGEVELDALNGLEKRLEQLNAKHGWGLSLFVPGDTVYGGPEMYGVVIIGRPLLMVSAWDPPTEFDPSTFAGRFSKLESLSDDDKKFIIETEDINIEAVGDADVHLVSGGPLCYGAVHVGVSMSEDNKDDAVYKYASNQDMEQMWGPDGIDAVYLMSVEFTDHAVFDHSAEKIAEHLARVPKLDNPKFFLLCRYD